MGRNSVKCDRCKTFCQGFVLKTHHKYFHYSCFNCVIPECGQYLGQCGFFYINGNLYCKNDYQRLKGIFCEQCKQYIEGNAVKAINKTFHIHCFYCYYCKALFLRGCEILYDGKYLSCVKCFIPTNRKEFVRRKQNPVLTGSDSYKIYLQNDDEIAKIKRVKCAGCGFNLRSNRMLLALQKYWHVWCFTCYICGTILFGEYMAKNNIPYCKRHYYDIFGYQCAGCKHFINGKVIQAQDKFYHPKCSRCSKCGDFFDVGEEMLVQGSQIWHPVCSNSTSAGLTKKYPSYETLRIRDAPSALRRKSSFRYDSNDTHVKLKCELTPQFRCTCQKHS